MRTMMELVRVIVLFVAQLAMLSQADSCDFPQFMQTNGTQREWHTGIKDQFQERPLQVYVEKNIMRTVATDSSATSHTRVCLQGYGDNRFLVAHEETGQQRNRYACIQFLRRTATVVQLRVSQVGDQMDRKLCGEGALTLDPWLIIDKTHIGSEEGVCGLKGGFSIRIFDKMRHQGICDGYKSETRMESECVRGDGLIFYFRQQKCVPEDLFMYSTQRTLCLASWTEGPHSFMLLRHDRFEYMWVMRYPTVLGGSFVSYLFKDLSADTSDQVVSTRNYLRLDTVRDTPRPVASLCVDDYEVCGVLRDPCSSGPLVALTCPRTCGICNASRPVLCSFERQFQGTWFDGAHLGELSLTVNRTQLAVHGDVREDFHCVRWDRPADPKVKFATDEMLVTEFHNGCRPRYTCVRFLQKSGSVMFMKLSQTLTWPFTADPSEPMDCTKFDFEHDENSVLPNRYRHKNYRLLYTKNSERGGPVGCGLPEEMTGYAITFNDGTDCMGTITETLSHQEIVLNLSNCTANPLGSSSFTCLETSKLLPTSDMMIVTRTSRQPYQIHCWMFPKRRHTTFYVLAGDQCNERTRRRLRKDRLKPLAYFSKHHHGGNGGGNGPNGTWSKIPPSRWASTTIPMDQLKSEDPGETPDTTLDKNNSTANHGNLTEAREFEVNPSPFVVMAAVLFFAVFQIPCICKSS